MVGDNTSTGSPEPARTPDFPPASNKPLCPRSLLKLSDLTSKQSGYRLSSNGFRSGESSEPVSVLLNTSSYPTSELLPSNAEQRAGTNNRPFSAGSSVLEPSQVPAPYTVTMATSCRSPEVGSKPLTPPVTPMSAGSPVTMATSSPVTPATGTQRDKLFHTPTPKSFSIADLLAPDSRPRNLGDSKPTLQLQASPKSSVQLQTSPTPQPLASPRPVEPVEEMKIPNVSCHLKLRKSPVPCPDKSSTVPTELAKMELSQKPGNQKPVGQRQALDMQYEQTNRNINYLRSFLLAQRLNTL